MTVAPALHREHQGDAGVDSIYLYSSIASRVFASIQPIRLSKNLTLGTFNVRVIKLYNARASQCLQYQRHIVNQALSL